MEADIEALRREREEKVRQIAEKRRQVEELKRRRAERAEQQKREGGGTRASADFGRSIDSLVAEILGGEVPASGTRPSPEGPLKELVRDRAALGTAPAKAAERSLNLQQDFLVAAVSVDPHETAVYERSVQTDVQGDEVTGSAAQKPPGVKRAPTSVLMKMAERARNRAVKPEVAAQDARSGKRIVVPAEAGVEGDAPASAAEPPHELTPEERKRVLGNPDFHAFFERATLLVERALGQETWDIAADFKNAAEDGGADEGSESMKHVDDYTEDRWSKGRPVTDVRFSPHRKEMFLASYGQRTNAALSDPDGCMLVWNLAMRSRPELTFTSPSAVLTAHFHRFDPALFYGGTYSGGILLWDARAKASPVLRTPLSSKGHSHPVQAMQQVGTKNATNLVTASNDGRLCVWSLAMLSVPQETIDLKNETKQRRDLAVMCLSFPENETNILYVGAEDGSVCQVHIHGSKVGVTELYDGHEGPVSGIDMHPHQSDASQHGVDTSFDLALTSSFDWSVKLWMVKQYQSPVLSFDCFEDYVYDARWHPSHPAVFASVDGEGHVDLWNLNRDLESPIVRCENPNQRRLALNHCHWSTDGRKLVTGDSEGTLSMYAVDRSVAQPRNEDFQQFQERMRQLQPIVPRSRDGGALDSRFAPVGRSPGLGLDARH